MATGVKITMFLFLAFISAVAQNVRESKVEEFHVGVVLDLGTTIGKVANTSISIAVEDFYAVHPNYTTRLILHVRDSKSDDVQAAYAEEMVKRFISRIVLIIWLFFLVVLKSSYTASLTSMLTVQQLQPTVTNVDDLLKNGEFVGYGRGSYIKGLLEELGFDESKIKPYDTCDDYHNVLSKGSKNGGVAAFVGEIPYIKLFLAEHCSGYTMVGPIYKTAGFGYALQKGSPIIGDISQAILNITGGDTIIQIEKKWIGDQNKCQNVGTISGTGSLSFNSFAGLIIATGVASTTSLAVALIIYFCKNKQVGPGNGDSEQILPQEEDKDGGDEESQCQEPAGARGIHEINKIIRNGSLVTCRGERIRSSWVSSSARF